MLSSIVRVTAHEFKKSFIQRHIVLFFIMLLAINVVYIYSDYMNGDYSQEYFLIHNDSTKLMLNFYEELHEKIDGDLTDTKVNFINSEINRLERKINKQTYSIKFSENTYTGYEYGDHEVLYRYFYLPLQYIINYQKANEAIIEKASENIQFYTDFNNQIDLKKNKYIIKKFTDRKLNGFYETHSWEKLFENKSSSFVIVLMIVLGILPIITRDSSTKMELLILTTTKGQQSMTLGRILSILLYVFFLCFCVLGINYIIYKLLYGLNGEYMPIYSIEKYAYSPLNCSLIEFYLDLLVTKFIGFYVIALVIYFISSLIRSSTRSLISGLIYILVNYQMGTYLESFSEVRVKLALLSSFSLVNISELFTKVNGINIFNVYVEKSLIIILVQVLLILVLQILIIQLILKRQKIDVFLKR